MKILVTGGAGFIGSAVVRKAIGERGYSVVNVDSLTYAANPANLASVDQDARYAFERVDIRDAAKLERVFRVHEPDAVMHLAAESHVDRSIDAPLAFVDTNVVGTVTLLQAARAYYDTLEGERREAFRFHHVSTDEVYGALGAEGVFTEESRYEPNSPYAASKAASDMMARAWRQTFKLPVVISNCSNNYGPFQFPEKLIPVVTLKALAGEPIPVYGDGANVRDWLFVGDHAEALLTILEKGRLGEVYNVGCDGERSNLDLVKAICAELDVLRPDSKPHADLITFVGDRPGHDFRYAIDASKIENELGWRPSVSIEEGLSQTVRWYLDNESWWRSILDGGYRPDRIGVAKKVSAQ